MKSSLSKTQAQRKFHILLAVQIIIGATLAFITYGVMQLFKSTAESELFGWLSITGAGVGASVGLMGLLGIILGADMLWLVFFLLWLLKKKMHLKDTDNTLRLP